MDKKIICLIAAFLALNIQAQDLRILVNPKGQVGYADPNGSEVITCQYESAQPFIDGAAIVSKSGKYGMIDTKGNVLLPLKYTNIQSWNKTLYLTKAGKKCGLVDHQGKIVLPFNYSFISKPNSYGKALIALGGKATASEKKTYMKSAKYGIIDSLGNLLITPQYKGLYEFSFSGKDKFPYYEGTRLAFSYHYTADTLVTDCSYVGFNTNGLSIYKSGVMDGTGKLLMKTNLFDFVMQPKSEMIRYYQIGKKKTSCGYYNISTGKDFLAVEFDKHIDNIAFWTHGDYIGDIAPVSGTSWSFIDKTGKILKTGYTHLKHSLIAGLWAAKNSEGKWEVFDDANNDVTALSNFTDINFPVNEGDKEIFSVQKDALYGCISRSGDIVIPLEYEYVYGNTFDFIAAKKDGKWGVLSTDNKILVPTAYASLLFPSERNEKHLWVMKSDSCYYHMNLMTNKLSTTGYKSVSNFVNGIAHVMPVGMVVDNTPVNRAQVFSPNSKLNMIDMKKFEDCFGYLLNVDDVYLIDSPVSTLYKERVIKEIQDKGNRVLTKAEKKNILLNVTRENRSYSLKSKINEEEWSY